jgi:hypothetical protein
MTTTSLTDQFLNLIKLKPNYSLKINEFKEKLIDCRTPKVLNLICFYFVLTLFIGFGLIS